MKSSLVSAVALATTLVVLTACQAATGNSPAKPEELTPKPEAMLPTVESLTGNWLGTSSGTFSSGSTTGVYSGARTLTFGVDGSYLRSEVNYNTPTTGPSTQGFYSYYQKKGTFSVSGIKLTITITHNRSSSTPFTDTTSGWYAYPTTDVVTAPAVVSGGKLYTQVMTAQGATSGIVGTWVAEAYYSPSSPSYYRYVYLMKPDNTFVAQEFQSSSWTLPATPSRTSSETYALSGTNQLTFTQSEPPTANGPSTSEYALVGSYFASGNDSIYTKQ